MHQVAAAYDLVLKPRGAGLVISHRSDGRLNAKASDVDRGLSLAALTARLGPYAASDGAPGPATPRASYQRPTPDKTLYAAFQAQREEAMRAREAARLQLAERHVAYARELAAWYRKRIRLEHSQQLRGALRRESFQHIAAERERDRVAPVERERGEREAMRAANPMPTWRGFLEVEAASGNQAAAAALRTQRGTDTGGRAAHRGAVADEVQHVERDNRGESRGR